MRFGLLSILAATLTLAACGSDKTSIEKVVVGTNATDDQKFAYMLGTQFGAQFAMIATQFGSNVNQEVFILGLSDSRKMIADTAFRLRLPEDTLRAVGARFQEKARLLRDSLQNKVPASKVSETESHSPATISGNSSDDDKFAYMLGVQFGTQFTVLGKQFHTSLDDKIFIQGIRDAHEFKVDSSRHLQIPEDTLRAVSVRYQEKAQKLRAEAQKKAMEEEQKIKQEIAPLRGDTLPDGFPKKMNYKVKISGVSVEASNLEGYSGKPLLIFYYSTTCGHCRHATPDVQKITNEFKDAGLTTIAIASGGNDKRSIRAFEEELKVQNMVMLFDEFRQFGELYSDGYVPKVYLVRPDGSYILYKEFEKDLEKVRADIKTLLKK